MIYRLSGLKGNLKNSQCLPSEAVLTLPSTLNKHLLCPGLGSSVLLDLAFVLRGNLSSCAFHPLGLVSQSFEKVKDYLPLAVCDDYTSNQPRTDGHFTYQTPRRACQLLNPKPPTHRLQQPAAAVGIIYTPTLRSVGHAPEHQHAPELIRDKESSIPTPDLLNQHLCFNKI